MAESKQDKGKFDPFTLRNQFPNLESILLSTPRLEHLTADCLFVLDTNALLAPFKIGTEGVKDVDKIFRELAAADRFFVPAQSLREFAKNRANALKDSFDYLHKRRSTIPALEALACPLLEGIPEYTSTLETIGDIKGALRRYKDGLNSLVAALKDWDWSDPISRLYRELITKERVINHDKSDQKIEADLERRTLHSVPPGYKDKAKADGGVGDLIIWETIIKLGKDKNRSVVFICNEEKTDWVVRTQNEVLAPRIELVSEFYREVGTHFGLIGFPRFLELMGASRDTVGRAKRAVTHVARYRFVEDRLDEIIRSLDQIASDYISGEDEAEYDRIRDMRFGDLVASFRHAKASYFALIDSDTGRHFLAVFDRLLSDMEDLDGQIAYAEATMKHSADMQMEELRSVCSTFHSIYGDYAGWRMANP